MFQSIKYLNYTYDNKIKLYYCHYAITDSDFISTSATAAAVVKEYEKRKTDHKEIVKNLFLLNMFILKDNWGYKDMNQILEYQHKYLIKEYYPESNFNEKYYDDLVMYTKKIMVIS